LRIIGWSAWSGSYRYLDLTPAKSLGSGLSSFSAMPLMALLGGFRSPAAIESAGATSIEDGA
jgi:hypothetical protein